MSIAIICATVFLLVEAVQAQVVCTNGTDIIDTPAYCNAMVDWTVSSDAIINWQNYDQVAVDLYNNLFTKWQNAYDGVNTVDGPGNDCLGIAQQVFCAYAYPYCDPSTGTIQPKMCDFVCELFSQRCTSETDIYNLMCSSKGPDNCQRATVLLSALQVLLLILALALI